MVLRSPGVISIPPKTSPVRRRGSRPGLAMVLAGALIVLSAGWLAVTGVMARGHLEQARADLPRLRAQVTAGDLAGAQVSAASFARNAARAHTLTSGPVWAFAARLPSGGEPLRTVRGVTAAVDSLGRATLPDLIEASDQLDPATLRTKAGTVDVARIAAVAPALDRAAASVARAVADMEKLPARTWLGRVDTARADLLTQLGSIATAARSADLAARIVPPLLGQLGRKSYFVAFQNDAEARGTGGLPGAFAIVTANQGKLTFDRFESDTTLSGVPAEVDFGADYDALYQGARTTEMYGSGNLSPHFPYAAQIWASMWEKHSGQDVDGVIALDPSTLSYLLAVTGPAKLPDKSTVSAANVVALTQSAAYSKFPNDEAARKTYLLDVARAASAGIVRKGDTAGLVKAGARAAGERRLLVWSADKALQAEIARTSVAGIVPKTTKPYAGLSIVNAGGNKLDYYLDRALTWRRTGCGPTRKVDVTVALTNNAPSSGLPASTVTARSDARGYPTKPGDNRLQVNYFGTAGAQLTSLTVNGKAATAQVGAERGHPVFSVDVELPRGTTRTVVLHLEEPAGSGPPIVLRQPLVRPLTVEIADADCN